MDYLFVISFNCDFIVIFIKEISFENQNFTERNFISVCERVPLIIKLGGGLSLRVDAGSLEFLSEISSVTCSLSITLL